MRKPWDERLDEQLMAAHHELVAAKRRRATGRKGRRIRRVALVLAVLGIGGSALGAHEVWRPLLGTPGSGPQPTLSTLRPPDAQLRMLAVLRRHVTEVDRGVSTATALHLIGPGARGVRGAFIRRLDTAPGQLPALLVPVAVFSGGGVLSARANAPLRDALCVVVLASPSRASGKACFDTARLASGKAFGRATGARIFGLVADDVAEVTLEYPHAPPVDAFVRSNFYEATAPGRPRTVRLRDTSGRTIKVFNLR